MPANQESPPKSALKKPPKRAPSDLGSEDGDEVGSLRSFSKKMFGQKKGPGSVNSRQSSSTVSTRPIATNEKKVSLASTMLKENHDVKVSDAERERVKEMERNPTLRQLTLHFDDEFTKRDWLLGVNVCVALIAMGLLYRWNFKCNDGEVADEACDVLSTDTYCARVCVVVITGWTQGCKFVISLCTLAQILQLYQYNRNIHRREGYIWNNPSLPFLKSQIFKTFLLEVVIYSMHTPPFLDNALIPGFMYGYPGKPWVKIFNDKMNLAVWLRLALLGRILRNHSKLYKKRQEIADAFLKKGYPVPNFNTFLIIKSMFHLKGVKTVSFSFCAISLVFCHVMYVTEREIGYKVGWSDPSGCLWFVAETVTTLGYGDFVPNSISGRAAAIITCMAGVFLTSLVIAIIIGVVTPAAHQQQAIDFMLQEDIRNTLLDAAVDYVLCVWRYKAKQRIWKAKYRMPTDQERRVIAQRYAVEVLLKRVKLRKAAEMQRVAKIHEPPPNPQLIDIAQMVKVIERNNQIRQTYANNWITKDLAKVSKIENRIEDWTVAQVQGVSMKRASLMRTSNMLFGQKLNMDLERQQKAEDAANALRDKLKGKITTGQMGGGGGGWGAIKKGNGDGEARTPPGKKKKAANNDVASSSGKSTPNKQRPSKK